MLIIGCSVQMKRSWMVMELLNSIMIGFFEEEDKHCSKDWIILILLGFNNQRDYNITIELVHHLDNTDQISAYKAHYKETTEVKITLVLVIGNH